MGNDDHIPTEKRSSSNNINLDVPLVLGLDQINCDLWQELFETHCIGFSLDQHLKPPNEKPSSSSEDLS